MASQEEVEAAARAIDPGAWNARDITLGSVEILEKTGDALIQNSIRLATAALAAAERVRPTVDVAMVMAYESGEKAGFIAGRDAAAAALSAVRKAPRTANEALGSAGHYMAAIEAFDEAEAALRKLEPPA